MLRLMIKILLLPVALILKAAGALLLGVANLSSYVIGPVTTFMIGCGIYSAFIRNWTNAVILAVAAGIVFLVYIAAGGVIGLLLAAGDGILGL
jgi:hypothetical protein